mmetsp:Transcript_16880/g.19437  ORF Transcript_16880/g.19437 Transcript_16880/m.19437 type:complete len:284 (+) Transcript_16880:1-852(+)
MPQLHLTSRRKYSEHEKDRSNAVGFNHDKIGTNASKISSKSITFDEGLLNLENENSKDQLQSSLDIILDGAQQHQIRGEEDKIDVDKDELIQNLHSTRKINVCTNNSSMPSRAKSCANNGNIMELDINENPYLGKRQDFLESNVEAAGHENTMPKECTHSIENNVGVEESEIDLIAASSSIFRTRPISSWTASTAGKKAKPAGASNSKNYVINGQQKAPNYRFAIQAEGSNLRDQSKSSSSNHSSSYSSRCRTSTSTNECTNEFKLRIAEIEAQIAGREMGEI